MNTVPDAVLNTAVCWAAWFRQYEAEQDTTNKQTLGTALDEAEVALEAALLKAGIMEPGEVIDEIQYGDWYETGGVPTGDRSIDIIFASEREPYEIKLPKATDVGGVAEIRRWSSHVPGQLF